MFMTKQRNDYNANLHEPLKSCRGAIEYWLKLGKRLRIDANYHVYCENRWIGDAKPKKR